MSINGWLYLIQRGYHRKQREEIYKIGRTNDFNRRINEYPPYSQIISVSPVVMIKNVKENLSGNLKMNLRLIMILVMNILKEMNEI
jgi:hypothetical protein